MAANTNFNQFLQHVNVAGLTCNNNSQYNETGWPKFVYGVTVRFENNSAAHGETWFLNRHNSTSEFNATLALTGAIYAVYTEKEIEATTTTHLTTKIGGANGPPPLSNLIWVAAIGFCPILCILLYDYFGRKRKEAAGYELASEKEENSNPLIEGDPELGSGKKSKAPLFEVKCEA